MTVDYADAPALQDCVIWVVVCELILISGSRLLLAITLVLQYCFPCSICSLMSKVGFGVQNPAFGGKFTNKNTMAIVTQTKVMEHASQKFSCDLCSLLAPFITSVPRLAVSSILLSR